MCRELNYNVIIVVEIEYYRIVYAQVIWYLTQMTFKIAYLVKEEDTTMQQWILVERQVET